MSTFEIVRSIDRLAALRSDWDALAAPLRSPLVGYEWLMSCAEAFKAETELRIGIVRSNGALDALAPLGLEQTAYGPRLTNLGASQLHEPTGWLFRSPAALERLVDGVMRMRRPLLLQRIADDSPLCHALPALAARKALTTVRRSTPSLAVRTQGSWDAYYRGLSSRVTSNLPRVRRKAERALGAMTVTAHVPEPSLVDRLLEQLTTVEGSGWKGRRGSSLARRPRLRDFFRRYCHRAAGRRRLHVTTLAFGSTPAAMELSVEDGNRMWQLKIGYQESVARYYPGLHLTEWSIRSAFERGLDAYEFLGAAESWEEQWRPEERHYRLMAVYPLNVSGMVGACRDVAGSVWRRAQSVMRPAVADQHA